MPNTHKTAPARRRRLALLLTAVTGAAAAMLTAAAPAYAAGCELTFYWSIDGSGTWQPENIAAAPCTVGPAITDSGTAVEIAAQAPGGSLWFYWANHGTATWHP